MIRPLLLLLPLLSIHLSFPSLPFPLLPSPNKMPSISSTPCQPDPLRFLAKRTTSQEPRETKPTSVSFIYLSIYLSIYLPRCGIYVYIYIYIARLNPIQSTSLHFTSLQPTSLQPNPTQSTPLPSTLPYTTLQYTHHTTPPFSPNLAIPQLAFPAPVEMRLEFPFLFSSLGVEWSGLDGWVGWMGWMDGMERKR